MRRRRRIVLHEPIYRSHVNLCVGYTFDDYRRLVHDVVIEPDHDDGDCSCAGDEILLQKPSDIAMKTTIVVGTSTLLVWVPRWPGRTSGAIAMLSHEMNHAALAILRRVGFTLTEDGEEALTYLQQWLMQAALERLKK